MQKESALIQQAEKFLESFSNVALQGLWDELQAEQKMLQEDYKNLKGLDAEAWKSPEAKRWRFSEKGIKYEIAGIIGQAANKLLQKRTMSFGEKVESIVDSFFGVLARCLPGGRNRFWRTFKRAAWGLIGTVHRIGFSVRICMNATQTPKNKNN
ncbi:MAG: hypothetical protein AB4426_19155 [Xenococcaceae cyanobacterium]